MIPNNKPELKIPEPDPICKNTQTGSWLLYRRIRKSKISEFIYIYIYIYIISCNKSQFWILYITVLVSPVKSVRVQQSPEFKLLAWTNFMYHYFRR